MTRTVDLDEQVSPQRLNPDGLRDLLAVVNSSRGIDEILTYLVRTTESVLQADGAVVYLVDSADRNLLRAQAEQRLGEILRRQQVAEALRDLLAAVNSTHDIHTILAEALRQSSRLLGSNAGVVYLRQRETDDLLRAHASTGFAPDQLAQEVRVGSPTTGLAVQKSRALVCWDLQEALTGEALPPSETVLEEFGSYQRVVRLGARTDPDLERGLPEPRVRRLADQFRAVLSVPLVTRGRTLGAITLFYTQPHRFTAEEVELATGFAQQVALQVRVRVDGDGWSLPPEVHIALYRIVQEALNNVAKHAAATQVCVHVRWRPTGVDVRIKDDGRGFAPGDGPRGRLGLGIMDERARSIAAHLRLQARPGAGTAVNLHWRTPAT